MAVITENLLAWLCLTCRNAKEDPPYEWQMWFAQGCFVRSGSSLTVLSLRHGFDADLLANAVQKLIKEEAALGIVIGACVCKCT